jgi:voltage-gated potassium channel
MVNPHDESLARERSELAATLDRWLEWPMVLLALVWLALLLIELISGLTPAIERLGLIIWGIFIAEFLLRWILAPEKLAFVRKNWLTAITLIVPAIRVLRVFRIARAIRGVRFVRIIGSINRGMNSLAGSMQRRGFPYVAAATLLVLVLGAAGMYAFEREAAPAAMTSYGDALWWTAMLLTTIGTDYWPRTA